MISGLVSVLLLTGLPATASGLWYSSGAPAGPSDSYWKRFALGAGVSLLAHESAHMLTSLALGFHPYLAFDKGRPTVFSGIDSNKYPHKQFLFSAAGLTTQALIDEAILDIPHSRGGAFERGMLAAGIGTTLFYITIGRNASVSDISVMARTSRSPRRNSRSSSAGSPRSARYGSPAIRPTPIFSYDLHRMVPP